MKSLKNASVKMIFADPPYGISIQSKKQNTEWDDLSDKELFNLLSNLLSEAERLLVEDGVLWMCYGPTKQAIVDSVIENSNLLEIKELHSYYTRQKGRGAKTKLKSLREDIVCLAKKNFRPNFGRIKELAKFRKENNLPVGHALDIFTSKRVPVYSSIGNCFFYTTPSYVNVSERQIHTCQKPVMLIHDLIELSTEDKDLILDPFAGSCASAIAASLSGRDYIGCEMDSDMFAKSKEWIEEFTDMSSRVYAGLSKFSDYPFADPDIKYFL